MKLDIFFVRAVIFEGGFGVVALVLGFLFGINFFLGVNIGVWEILTILCLTLFLLFFYFVLRSLPFASLRAINRLLDEVFQQYMSHLSVLQLAVISIAAGFGEELFFRGLLQTGIYNAVIGWANNMDVVDVEFCSNCCLFVVLIFVSILFGLAHALTKMYFVFAFLVSVYLGLILIVTGNIIIPIIIHALYDFIVLTLIKRKNNV